MNLAADFFKKESRSPRGFLPRPLLRAGESVAPPPLPQKNSGGAHHFRFRFLDLCIRFGKIISKVCEGFDSGAKEKSRLLVGFFLWLRGWDSKTPRCKFDRNGLAGGGFFPNPKQNKNSDTRSEFLFWLRTLNEIRTFFSENPNAEF